MDEGELFARRFLLRRPLLEALEADPSAPVVLLIDEIDRADDEFEAFLLEFLSDFAVTIPELGTVSARRRPIVILTSNRTRELHDALKRRCLYHWIDYPDAEREREIVHARLPGVPEAVAARVVAAVRPPARAGRPVQAARGRGDDRVGPGAAGRRGTELNWTTRWERRSRCTRTFCGSASEECWTVSDPVLGEAVVSPLAALTAALRAQGSRVGVGELLAAHRALAMIDSGSREDARLALRAVLCSNRVDPAAL